MKARARSQAVKPLSAITMCAPFVIKPVAVPPAEIFGCQMQSATKDLSGDKITVFSLSLARFYAECAWGRKGETLNADRGFAATCH